MQISPSKRRKISYDTNCSNQENERAHSRHITIEPSILCQFSDEVNIDFRILERRHGRLSHADIVKVLHTMADGLSEGFNVKDYEKESCFNDYFEKKEDNYLSKLKIVKEDVILLHKSLDPIAKKKDDDDNSDTPPIKVIPSTTPEEQLANKKASAHRLNTTIHEYLMNQGTLKKVSVLRYRESVYRAACALIKDMPPFPTWSYKDKDHKDLKTSKINVGGEIFEVFNTTVVNLSNTKVGKLIKDHDVQNIPFIDRDPVCFNAILNFYRTGRLHVPPNTCLTFFEEELEFWGIDDDFMEACCWGDYQTAKVASCKLKKYSEDSDKSQMYYHTGEGRCSDFSTIFFKVLTSGTGSIAARWVATSCAFFILLGIMGMIMSTTTFGRIDRATGGSVTFPDEESVSNFLERSKTRKELEMLDFLTTGFFSAELLLRLILCPVKLEFFRDTFNWIDLLATLTSLVSEIAETKSTSGSLEAYTLILKIPRILRLLKLTANLRSGIEALVLTLIASIKELVLVFFIFLMLTLVFGCIIFAVEMMDSRSKISNIYIGMWWALETLPGVGYGDFVPRTPFGYVTGSMCIMIGVIVCQIPVPIFLKNFSVYYNQASARLVSQSDLLLSQNVDKREILLFENHYQKMSARKKKKNIP